MIKCAIIGLGRIGSFLEDDSKREKPATHAGVIDHHAECEIIAASDINEKRTTAFSKRWDCPKIYNDYRLMLHNHSIDILHIATPPETHRQIIHDAAKKNIPVIILEKPVAHSIKDARKILKICRETKTRIVINHERRYSLQYRRCKEIIDDEVYGKLLSLNTKLYMGRTRKLRNMLYDDGTHMVDLIHFLTQGQFIPKNILQKDKNQIYAAGLSGMTSVMFEAGNSRDHLLFEIDLSFQTGRIIAGNGYYKEYTSTESPFYENFRSLQKTDIVFQYSRYFIEMFADAVHSFKNPSHKPVSSVEDGVLSLETIEVLLKSL